MMKKKSLRAAAAILAAGLAFGVGVQTAQATDDHYGQVANGKVVGSWSYTWTYSQGNSISTGYNHYALAKQDGETFVDNQPAKLRASQKAYGVASNKNDYASAGLGWRG